MKPNIHHLNKKELLFQLNNSVCSADVDKPKCFHSRDVRKCIEILKLCANLCRLFNVDLTIDSRYDVVM